MFVYSSVFTSFQSLEDSTASAGDAAETSKATLVANAVPTALKKPLRDSCIKHTPFLSIEIT
jgi:hypothetical protein